MTIDAPLKREFIRRCLEHGVLPTTKGFEDYPFFNPLEFPFDTLPKAENCKGGFKIMLGKLT